MSAQEEKKGPDRLVEVPSLRFGPFTFDPRRHELLRHGHRVSMSASQMRLLTLFMERRGELVTREEIAARLWTDTRTIDVDTGINTAVNRLRRNLQEAPGAAAPIETVIGLGYRFVPVLVQAEPIEDVADQVPTVDETSGEPPPIALNEAVASGEVSRADADRDDTRELETTEPELRVPPALLPSPDWNGWIVAAVLAVVLVVAFGIFAMRRSATRAATAPKPNGSAAARPSTAPPWLRVTSDEEDGKLTAAAVSPSGQLVAYADRYGVSVRSLPLSATRLLGARPSFTIDHLSWAPDESGLLTSGTDKELHRQQVWFQPVDSPYARLLIENASRATLSPDGSKMAFLRERDLWVAAADGRNPRLLRSAAKGETFDLVLWSPTGTRLLTTVGKTHSSAAPESAAETGSGGAYEFLDAESGNLVHREEGFAAASGYLLQNGSLFYVENANGGPTSPNASIMSVQLDLSSGRMLGAPKRVRDLAALRADHLSASLTGTHTSIVLQQAGIAVFVADLGRQGQPLSHVTRLPWNGREIFPHSWTADAKAILVESDFVAPDAPPKWAIYQQPVDGTSPTLLASTPGNPAMAQLTPDGRWIMFLEFTGVSPHAKATFQIPATALFRMPATGGPIEQVRTTGNIENFRCSASAVGRCVVREAVSNREFVYYALDPLRGIGEELGRTAWQPRLLGDWGLSADGRTVAIVSHDALHPHISLFRLGTNPAQMQEIAVQGHGTTLAATFAPDGKSLFVECQTESGFELVRLELDGQLNVLRRSPFQIWAVPSRDGNRIAFPDHTVTSSLWTADDKP